MEQCLQWPPVKGKEKKMPEMHELSLASVISLPEIP